MADPTKVEIGLSYKVNTGNYENLNVHVLIGDYVRSGETLDTAVDRVYNKVEKTLVGKVSEARESFKEG